MTKLSIIAGCPFVRIQEDIVHIEPQDFAFDLAMKSAEKNEEKAKIFLPIDHPKRFNKSFVDPTQVSSGSQLERLANSRSISLDLLREEIRSHFNCLLENTQFSLKDITVLPESHSKYFVNKHVDSRLYKGSCNLDNTQNTKPNCAGITSSICADAAKDIDLLVGFWELHPKRVVQEKIHLGTLLAYELRDVRSHTVNIFMTKNDVVSKIAYSPNQQKPSKVSWQFLKS